MKVILLGLTVCIGLAGANICTDTSGSWSYEISSGVTDFAYMGAALNKKYFCFDGCLATQTAVQNYKVDLYNTSTLSTYSKLNRAVLERKRDGDDPNADSCIDPVLRADVAAAIAKATTSSAKAIGQALQYNLNRSGWAIVVVAADFAVNSIYLDVNFCEYSAMVGDVMYVIKVAKLDMS